MVFCKRDRKATEQALLAAASKLFSEKGYENTRTLDIAKEAGANEALIGRYFGGKEGLLAAVLRDESTSTPVIKSEHTQCNTHELPARESGMDFKDALKVYFKHGEAESVQKEEFVRIAMARSLVDKKMSQIVQEQVIENKLPPLADSLNQYLDGAVLTKEEKSSIAMLIAATNHTFNFLGKRVHRLDPESLEKSLQILTDSLHLYLESKGKKK